MHTKSRGIYWWFHEEARRKTFYCTFHSKFLKLPLDMLLLISLFHSIALSLSLVSRRSLPTAALSLQLPLQSNDALPQTCIPSALAAQLCGYRSPSSQKTDQLLPFEPVPWRAPPPQSRGSGRAFLPTLTVLFLRGIWVTQSLPPPRSNIFQFYGLKHICSKSTCWHPSPPCSTIRLYLETSPWLRWSN